MTSSLITTTLPLAHKATMRIDDPAGLEITCTQGSIWLTLDGNLRDIILTAGTAEDRFVTDQHRVAILYALQPSQIAVAAAGAQVAATQGASVQARCEREARRTLLPLATA